MLLFFLVSYSMHMSFFNYGASSCCTQLMISLLHKCGSLQGSTHTYDDWKISAPIAQNQLCRFQLFISSLPSLGIFL